MCKISCYDNFLRMQNHGLSAVSHTASLVMHLSKAANTASAKTGAFVENIGKWALPVAGVVLALDKLELCGITERCIKITSPGFKDGLNTEFGMHCLIIAIGVFAALKLTESLSDSLHGTSKNVMSGCENWRTLNSQEIYVREKALKEHLKNLEEQKVLKEHQRTLEEQKAVKESTDL